MSRLLNSFFFGLGLLAVISFVGCGGSGDVASDGSGAGVVESDDHDHDHDHGDDEGHDDEGHDHAEHEHPAHGLNGGHMVKLDDGSEIEVALNKEDDSFAIFPADANVVSSVKMVSKVEDAETTYEFATSEASDLAGAFVLTSPELATAVRMGDAVEVTLVIETEAGTASTRYQHHEH